jgi:transcriptional regulator with XRE-family HTH domain
MPTTPPELDFASALAENVRRLREAQELTQAELAARAGLPRATLSLLESGSANPTLSVVLRVSKALDVRLEELLETRPTDTHVYRRGELPERQRGGVTVKRLLPEHVDGLDIEQLVIPPGRTLVGIPHTPGTREYLAIDSGSVELRVSGNLHLLDAGDVAVFRGNQKHSYRNPGRGVARAFSVIAFARPSRQIASPSRKPG